MNHKEKIHILLFLIFIAFISITFLHPIAQNSSYHSFADKRILYSVPNFWNVLSNLPFLIVGTCGMIYVCFKYFKLTTFKLTYFIFFTGIFLTGIGSSYYHLHPNNNTLVWDRLPMTISFMSFFSIILTEFIDAKKGKLFLFPLLIVGISSVAYWHYSELKGFGDLRLYALVQFLPMILIPLIMVLFKSKKNNIEYIWLMLLAYALSKVFETFDNSVFEHLHLISGHSIKHVFAAAAPILFLLWMTKQKIPSE
jgi:hypothetical protein